MTESPEHINVPQAADILGVSTRTVYRWLRQGRLTFVTGPDGRRAICRDDVIAMACAKARQVARHGNDQSPLHQELCRQRILLEQLQHRLDWQTELLEALIRLSPVDSIEGLTRKREMLEALERGADDRPGFR